MLENRIILFTARVIYVSKGAVLWTISLVSGSPLGFLDGIYGSVFLGSFGHCRSSVVRFCAGAVLRVYYNAWGFIGHSQPIVV